MPCVPGYGTTAKGKDGDTDEGQAEGTKPQRLFGAHVARLSMVRRSLTGMYIPCPGVGNICHLYPKRRYKSVAEDNDNVIYLTIDEHTRFDYLLDTMDFDRLLEEFGDTWLLVAKKMRDLAPKVEEDGKLKTRLLLWIEENKDYF